MSFMFSKPKMPSPPPMPAEPKPKKIAQATSKKIRRGVPRNQTIATSPLGLSTAAPVEKKSLLGL